MSHIQTSRAWFAMALLLVMIIPACARSSPFAVNYSGSGWARENLNTYIILQTPDADSVLAVRHVTHEGNVDFGDVGAGRVSVTFADSNFQSWYLTTYRNAPGGTWSVHFPPHDSLGRVEIVVPRPAGDYTGIAVQWSGYGDNGKLVAGDTVAYRLSRPVYKLEPGNTLSLMARVSGASPTYFGWLLDQPFVPDQVNRYTITLDHPAEARPLTTSRPVKHLQLSAIRTPPGAIYPLYGEDTTAGKTHFTMDYTPFPASQWMIEAAYRDQTEQFIYDATFDQIPSALEIPTSSLNADYNRNSRRYENVRLTGTADFLRFSWFKESTAGSYVHWDVVCAPGLQTVSLPTLPDSLLRLFAAEDTLLLPDYLFMKDFAQEDGYDAYIARKFASPSNAPAPIEESYLYARPIPPPAPEEHTPDIHPH
jgi:hypothetical protein